MAISDSQLGEFIALYRAEFGVALTIEEAREAAAFIVRLVKAVYGNKELSTYNESYENEPENK